MKPANISVKMGLKKYLWKSIQNMCVLIQAFEHCIIALFRPQLDLATTYSDFLMNFDPPPQFLLSYSVAKKFNLSVHLLLILLHYYKCFNNKMLLH